MPDESKEKKHRRRASIIPRGENKHLVRIYIGRHPDTGKRQYSNTMITGKWSVAEKFATKELAKLDAGTFTLPTKLTTKKHLTDWLEIVKKIELEPETFEGYKFQLEKYIYPGLGNEPLAKLTFEKIQGHYNTLYDNGKGKSPRTIQYANAVLSQGLDYAVRRRLIPNNPCQFVSVPKQDQTEKSAFTEEQAGAFLAATRQCRHFLLFLLALATGLRPGEFSGLRWSDVEKKCLSIRQAVVWPKGGGWRFKAPKTKKGRRSVPIGPGIAALLATHRRKQMEIRLKAGSKWQDYDLVFCTDIGTPYRSKNLLRRHLRKILEIAQLDKNFNLYTLRHSFATLSIASGTNVKVVSERMGHASATMTTDIYTHVIPSMEDGTAGRLEDLLLNDLAHRSHTEKETGTD